MKLSVFLESKSAFPDAIKSINPNASWNYPGSPVIKIHSLPRQEAWFNPDGELDPTIIPARPNKQKTQMTYAESLRHRMETLKTEANKQ